METFATVLRNERKNPLIVYEKWGPLLSIWPGNEKTIETDDHDGMYAPFTKVTWLKSGEVVFSQRWGYRESQLGRWTIRCLNLNGHESEQRVIGGAVVLLPRGIPRTIEIPVLGDPLMTFKSLTIKRVEVTEPNSRHPHYLNVDYVVKDVLEARPKDELAEIQHLLEAEEVKAENEAAKAAGKSAPDDVEFR